MNLLVLIFTIFLVPAERVGSTLAFCGLFFALTIFFLDSPKRAERCLYPRGSLRSQSRELHPRCFLLTPGHFRFSRHCIHRSTQVSGNANVAHFLAANNSNMISIGKSCYYCSMLGRVLHPVRGSRGAWSRPSSLTGRLPGRSWCRQPDQARREGCPSHEEPGSTRSKNGSGVLNPLRDRVDSLEKEVGLRIKFSLVFACIARKRNEAGGSASHRGGAQAEC